MQELIAKLEAATEGNRTLDWEIHHAMHEEFGAYGDHPHYTTSYDAAEALVADMTRIDTCHRKGRNDARCAWAHLENDDGEWEARAATQPLALCIASLRAREKQK